MSKEEILIKAGQMYSFEDWFAIVGHAYTLKVNKNNPMKDYAEYVKQTVEQFAD